MALGAIVSYLPQTTEEWWAWARGGLSSEPLTVDEATKHIKTTAAIVGQVLELLSPKELASLAKFMMMINELADDPRFGGLTEARLHFVGVAGLIWFGCLIGSEGNRFKDLIERLNWDEEV